MSGYEAPGSQDPHYTGESAETTTWPGQDKFSEERELIYEGTATLPADVREIARAEARAQVASLCGLVLGRLGELEEGSALERELRSIFGEALQQYSAPEEKVEREEVDPERERARKWGSPDEEDEAGEEV